MVDTPACRPLWAERAHSSGALDPSLGQAFAFPSLLQLRMRIEVPVWRDLATARNPTVDLPAFFFPRVRTPCGHGAQVIIEGREERQMVEKGTKTPKNQPKNQPPKPAGRLHYLEVFPIHKVKRVKLRLATTSGPEFAKEEDCSANCVHGKPPRRLQTDFPYQVMVTSGHTTVWQNKATLQVRCLAMLQQCL